MSYTSDSFKISTSDDGVAEWLVPSSSVIIYGSGVVTPSEISCKAYMREGFGEPIVKEENNNEPWIYKRFYYADGHIGDWQKMNSSFSTRLLVYQSGSNNLLVKSQRVSSIEIGMFQQSDTKFEHSFAQINIPIIPETQTLYSADVAGEIFQVACDADGVALLKNGENNAQKLQTFTSDIAVYYGTENIENGTRGKIDIRLDYQESEAQQIGKYITIVKQGWTTVGQKLVYRVTFEAPRTYDNDKKLIWPSPLKQTVNYIPYITMLANIVVTDNKYTHLDVVKPIRFYPQFEGTTIELLTIPDQIIYKKKSGDSHETENTTSDIKFKYIINNFDGKGPVQHDYENNKDNVKIYVSTNGSTDKNNLVNGSYNLSNKGDLRNKKFTFSLYKDDELKDVETVPVLEDGKDTLSYSIECTKELMYERWKEWDDGNYNKPNYSCSRTLEWKVYKRIGGKTTELTTVSQLEKEHLGVIIHNSSEIYDLDLSWALKEMKKSWLWYLGYDNMWQYLEKLFNKDYTKLGTVDNPNPQTLYVLLVNIQDNSVVSYGSFIVSMESPNGKNGRPGRDTFRTEAGNDTIVINTNSSGFASAHTTTATLYSYLGGSNVTASYTLPNGRTGSKGGYSWELLNNSNQISIKTVANKQITEGTTIQFKSTYNNGIAMEAYNTVKILVNKQPKNGDDSIQYKLKVDKNALSFKVDDMGKVYAGASITFTAEKIIGSKIEQLTGDSFDIILDKSFSISSNKSTRYSADSGNVTIDFNATDAQLMYQNYNDPIVKFSLVLKGTSKILDSESIPFLYNSYTGQNLLNQTSFYASDPSLLTDWNIHFNNGSKVQNFIGVNDNTSSIIYMGNKGNGYIELVHKWGWEKILSKGKWYILSFYAAVESESACITSHFYQWRSGGVPFWAGNLWKRKEDDLAWSVAGNTGQYDLTINLHGKKDLSNNWTSTAFNTGGAIPGEVKYKRYFYLFQYDKPDPNTTGILWEFRTQNGGVSTIPINFAMCNPKLEEVYIDTSLNTNDYQGVLPTSWKVSGADTLNIIWRTNEWQPGQTYRNDEVYTAGDRYVDLVTVTNPDAEQYHLAYEVYKCLKTHESTSSNKPAGKTTANWLLFESHPPIATPAIFAENAKFRFSQLNKMMVTNQSNKVCAGMQGIGADTEYTIWSGGKTADDEATNFKVNGKGLLFATDANISGTINASAGFFGPMHIITDEENSKISEATIIGSNNDRLVSLTNDTIANKVNNPPYQYLSLSSQGEYVDFCVLASNEGADWYSQSEYAGKNPQRGALKNDTIELNLDSNGGAFIYNKISVGKYIPWNNKYIQSAGEFSLFTDSAKGVEHPLFLDSSVSVKPCDGFTIKGTCVFESDLYLSDNTTGSGIPDHYHAYSLGMVHTWSPIYNIIEDGGGNTRYESIIINNIKLQLGSSITEKYRANGQLIDESSLKKRFRFYVWIEETKDFTKSSWSKAQVHYNIQTPSLLGTTVEEPNVKAPLIYVSRGDSNIAWAGTNSRGADTSHNIASGSYRLSEETGSYYTICLNDTQTEFETGKIILKKKSSKPNYWLFSKDNWNRKSNIPVLHILIDFPYFSTAGEYLHRSTYDARGKLGSPTVASNFPPYLNPKVVDLDAQTYIKDSINSGAWSGRAMSQTYANLVKADDIIYNAMTNNCETSEMPFTITVSGIDAIKMTPELADQAMIAKDGIYTSNNKSKLIFTTDKDGMKLPEDTNCGFMLYHDMSQSGIKINNRGLFYTNTGMGTYINGKWVPTWTSFTGIGGGTTPTPTPNPGGGSSQIVYQSGKDITIKTDKSINLNDDITVKSITLGSVKKTAWPSGGSTYDLPTAATNKKGGIYTSESYNSNKHTLNTAVNGNTLYVERPYAGTGNEGAVNFHSTNTSSGKGTVAMGYSNTVTGNGSAVVGHNNTVSGEGSFAVGQHCQATIHASFALGYWNEANGNQSFAGGEFSRVFDSNSIGYGKRIDLLKGQDHSAAFGISNNFNGNPIFAIGIGNADATDRRNGFAVSRDGKVYVKGLGGYDGTNQTSSTTKDLATVVNSKGTGGGSTGVGRPGGGIKSEEFNDDYNNASGNYSHAEGRNTEAYGEASHAEGFRVVADGQAAHAEGYNSASTYGGLLLSKSNQEEILKNWKKDCTANSMTNAYGTGSHAEGRNSSAIGSSSHAEGSYSMAYGADSHAEGLGTLAEGRYTHSQNYQTQAIAFASTAIGYKNKPESITQNDKLQYNAKNTAFVIGGGDASSTRNVFKVDFSGNVSAAGTSSYSSADYAEMFEWLDGNPNKEDRIGRFVSMDGDKIKLANSTDNYIIGIISGNPSVIGDNPMDWHGKYVNDIWGRPVYSNQKYEVESLKIDKNGNIIKNVIVNNQITRTLSEHYEGALPYVERLKRQEWSPVGMLGKLLVLQDGTLKLGQFCYPGKNGIATHSECGYYVMKVINEMQALIIFK